MEVPVGSFELKKDEPVIVERPRTRWEKLSIGARKSFDKLFKRGEYKEISITEAIGRIDKAPSIIEDKGISVFGREVEDPLAYTVKYLQESMNILAKKEGDSVNVGRLFEVLGDILAKDTTHDGKVSQVEWDDFVVAQYREAMRIYGTGKSMKYGIVDIKQNVILCHTEDYVMPNGEHYGYRKDLVDKRAEERKKRREEDHIKHSNISV